MLRDLDTLMASRSIDVVVVPMHEAMHPAFRWLTRGAKVTRGYAVKRAGAAPVLVTYPMEREEAAATGLTVRLAHEFGSGEIFRKLISPAAAYAELFDGMLRALGASGTVAFFGNLPFQLYHGIALHLGERGWRVHRSDGEDLIQLARKRKEPWEIEAVRSVGERTEQVVDEVRAILRDARVDGGRVLHGGQPLTLGDLKAVVSAGIARRGMIEDHDTILSQGRDAAVPHSRGDAAAPLRPSLPIVLDIFPADRASGYFFDLTRTFCVGPVPPELRRLHGDVLEAFQMAAAAMKPWTTAASYQRMVCELFEAKGYPTTRTDPRTLEGYVHGLGHGVGLEIHERPSFSLSEGIPEPIEVGDIVTIEPGLYFPDRELGVRIEDTFVVEEEGVRTLCRGGYGLEP